MDGDEYAAGAYYWGCPYIPGPDASTVAVFAAQPVAPSTAMSSRTSLPRKGARRTFENVAAEFVDYPDTASFRCAADAEAACLARVKLAPYLGLLRVSTGLDTPFARMSESRAYVGNLLAGSSAGRADGDYPEVDLLCCALPRPWLEGRRHETVNTRTLPWARAK